MQRFFLLLCRGMSEEQSKHWAIHILWIVKQFSTSNKMQYAKRITETAQVEFFSTYSMLSYSWWSATYMYMEKKHRRHSYIFNEENIYKMFVLIYRILRTTFIWCSLSSSLVWVSFESRWIFFLLWFHHFHLDICT